MPDSSNYFPRGTVVACHSPFSRRARSELFRVVQCGAPTGAMDRPCPASCTLIEPLFRDGPIEKVATTKLRSSISGAIR